MLETCTFVADVFGSNGTDGGGCRNLADDKYWPVIHDELNIPWLEVIFISLFLIILLVGLIANSLTLAVFCQLQPKLLWNNNNLLVLLNLCICDNIMIFLIAPLTLVILFSGRVFQSTLYQQDTDMGTKVICNATGFVFNYCSRALLFFLSLGACDRFVALFVPFKYKSIVTPTRVKFCLAISHLCSLLLSLAPFIAGSSYNLDMHFAACHYDFESLVKPVCDSESGECYSDSFANSKVVNTGEMSTAYFFLVFLVVAIPAVLMLGASLAVVGRLYKRLNLKVAERTRKSVISKEAGNLLGKEKDKKNNVKVDPEEYAAGTIMYLVFLYVLCYLPWWVMASETSLEYTGLVRYRAMMGGVSGRSVHYFFLYLTFMTFVSSAINPIIYFGRNKNLVDKLEQLIKFRQTIRQKKPSLRDSIGAPLMTVPTF